MAVRKSCHPVTLLTTEESTPLESKAVMVCATCASAVGETKLALAAIVGGGRIAPCVSRSVRVGRGEEEVQKGGN
jgi:hypothetical protein